MAVIGQPIDDMAGGELRELHHGFVFEGPQDDGVHELADGARVIGNRLALAKARVRLGNENAGAAEMGHGRLEADPRAQRWFLENQPEHAPLHGGLVFAALLRFL